MIKWHWVNDAWFLAKRLYSVRLALLGSVWASAAGAWLLLPDDWRPTLSNSARWVLAIIGIMLAAAPGVAAVVHQPKLVAAAQERKVDAGVDVEPPSAAP